ncbi:MAG TPA: hypothetical protein VF832_08770, partial [Longimicrobiales bacterium]
MATVMKDKQGAASVDLDGATGATGKNDGKGNGRKRKLAPIILGLLALVGIGFGVNHYLFSLHHVETDDA